jgi:hypothetical protein
MQGSGIGDQGTSDKGDDSAKGLQVAGWNIKGEIRGFFAALRMTL